MAGVAKELSLSDTPGFNRTPGVDRRRRASAATERAFAGSAPISQEIEDGDDRNGDSDSYRHCLVHSRLTVSLSGRPPIEIGRHARTIFPARMARPLDSHSRSKRWLDVLDARLRRHASRLTRTRQAAALGVPQRATAGGAQSSLGR